MKNFSLVKWLEKRVILAFVVLVSFSCGSKKTIIEQPEPSDVEIEKLIEEPKKKNDLEKGFKEASSVRKRLSPEEIAESLGLDEATTIAYVDLNLWRADAIKKIKKENAGDPSAMKTGMTALQTDYLSKLGGLLTPDQIRQIQILQAKTNPGGVKKK